MTFSWAICLASEDAAAVAGLRLTPGIEVAEAEGRLWLRGPAADEALALALQQLPASARYEVVKDNQLRGAGQKIPSGLLPTLRWETLKSWLRLELPNHPAVGERKPQFPVARIRLVRSTEERQPNVILTSLDDWREFASSAPEVRLRPLQFAVNSEQGVLVRGEPLPPLPGRRFVVEASVAAPAGFAWEPAVSAAVLAQFLGLGEKDLALLNEDGTVSLLRAEQFVEASRSAIRETVAEFEESPA